jgi:regulatory protein YycH of two-component signal transduction system YycFG
MYVACTKKRNIIIASLNTTINTYSTRFEVFTVTNVMAAIFWDVTLCSQVKCTARFNDPAGSINAADSEAPTRIL